MTFSLQVMSIYICVLLLLIPNILYWSYILYRLIFGNSIFSEEPHDGRLMWDRYNTLSVIYDFLQLQAELHPSFVSTFTIGKTYEGRSLTGIKLSKNSWVSKPAIWIDSNIHGCEWISGAIGTYLIDQLIYSNDLEIKQWLFLYEFYILPIANPDGYEYTFTHDRFWRKTRSNTSSPLGCKGVDPNRNFDFKWEDGVDTDPCSDTYKGSTVYSEPETKAMADFITRISDRLIFYLSLHSSGQFILFPTAFSRDHIPQYNTYKRICAAAADASSKRFSTQFRVGNVVELIDDKVTGSSMDFVKEKFNTNLTLTYELRDNGQYYEHLLPPHQILPSALEFMDGFKIIMQELAKGIPQTDAVPIV